MTKVSVNEMSFKEVIFGVYRSIYCILRLRVIRALIMILCDLTRFTVAYTIFFSTESEA